MLGGNATIMLLFLINAIFRGAGDAAIAMRVLWLANAINIVLGPCFIFGLGPFPELGVTGAAVATTIGRGTACSSSCACSARGAGAIARRARHLRLDPAVMWTRVPAVGRAALFQILIGTASWIGLVRILSAFGSAALAGYTIGIRIDHVRAAAVVGAGERGGDDGRPDLGAGKPERAEQAVWTRGLLQHGLPRRRRRSCSWSSRRPIVGVFTNDPAVARATRSTACGSSALGFVFYAYGMVLTQSFNGAGDTWTPTWINLGCFWCWEIPLAWLLALHFGWGPKGVFLAITIAFSTLAVVSAVLFRRGRWKLKAV